MITSLEYDRLADAIHQGFLIIYPTDTLYAIGASVKSQKAIEQVFSLKQRPRTLPLPVSVDSMETINDIAELNPMAQALISAFLPGPLTLVLQNKTIPKNITSGKNTVAIRIPNDEIALALLKKTGPLTVTSANIHGQSTPTSIDEIRNMFISSNIVAYIDDGTRNGSPSTIVDMTAEKPVILRQGSISAQQIDSVVSLHYG